MATINTSNFGIAQGRLTKDPVFFDNKDGSKKVMITVAAQDSFKNAAGERTTQFIQLEGFISNKSNGIGVYAYMHKGDMVNVAYGVRTNNYEKDGKTVYSQVLSINGVQLLETKKSQAARTANAVAAEQVAAEAAAAVADDDAPFEE